MKSTNVFVYGTLKKGFPNHHVLGEQAEYVGGASTHESFTLIDLGAFPALSLGGDVKDQVPISGEVYKVPNLAALDRLEGYPHFYDRMQINTTQGLAWVYHVKIENYPDHPKVVGGDWVKNYNIGS